jgi:hypothetical protein
LASEYEPGVFFSISVMLEMLPINLTNLSINSYLQNFDLPFSGLPTFVLIISGWGRPVHQMTEKLGALQGILVSLEVSKYMEGRFRRNGGGRP